MGVNETVADAASKGIEGNMDAVRAKPRLECRLPLVYDVERLMRGGYLQGTALHER